MDGATSEDSTSCFEIDPHVADQAIQQHQETMYACNICFETATHLVATTCGHLFCRECLFAWLQGHPRPCPVCRTNLIRGVNIIPLFTFTSTDVVECLVGEPRSNTVDSAMIPQQPPPPSPDQILVRPSLVPSAVGAGINTMDDLTSILEEIEDDLTNHFEISRERVDSLGQTVEDLVQWCLMLRQENDRNVQQIDLMNRRHAQEIAAIRRHCAEEIDRMRHIHSNGRV